MNQGHRGSEAYHKTKHWENFINAKFLFRIYKFLQSCIVTKSIIGCAIQIMLNWIGHEAITHSGWLNQSKYQHDVQMWEETGEPGGINTGLDSGETASNLRSAVRWQRGTCWTTAPYMYAVFSLLLTNSSAFSQNRSKLHVTH